MKQTYITPEEELMSYELTKSIIIKEQLKSKSPLTSSQLKTLKELKMMADGVYGDGYKLAIMGDIFQDFLKFIRDNLQDPELTQQLLEPIQIYMKNRRKNGFS